MKSSKIISALFFFLFIGSTINAQEHFLVELENRSPGAMELVKSFEGYEAVPFLANDVNGVEQSIMGYQGKAVVLWFWNQDCMICKKQISALNLLAQKFPYKLQILGFADESKEKTISFLNNNPVDFPVIANSKTLAEGPYGGEMGYPRLFIIDQKGMVKWVFPEETMRGDFDTYKILETLVTSLYK